MIFNYIGLLPHDPHHWKVHTKKNNIGTSSQKCLKWLEPYRFFISYNRYESPGAHGSFHDFIIFYAGHVNRPLEVPVENSAWRCFGKGHDFFGDFMGN
jgi:hypothetical protein